MNRVLSSVTPADRVPAAKPYRADRATIVSAIVRDITNGETGGTFVFSGHALRRYVVGGYSDSVVIKRRASRAALVESVHAFVSAVPDNEFVDGVGFWVDSETGRVWLDAVSTYADHGAAVATAEWRGELALWDNVKREEIRVTAVL